MKNMKTINFVLLQFFIINSIIAYSNNSKYSVHHIAQACNKNALKIKKYMNYHGIFPKKINALYDYHDNNLTIENETIEFILIPSWLILEKFNQSLNRDFYLN